MSSASATIRYAAEIPQAWRNSDLLIPYRKLADLPTRIATTSRASPGDKGTGRGTIVI
jgi:hypothetical protein